MLRDVVGTFLDSLTEREFDAPLLAILAAEGFADIHLIHGQFEFGKDVIAKRYDAELGRDVQYAIQSKAGDIGQPAWRDVRPQLEEAEYNTRAHPAYDENLPRVAVLLMTGRFKGGAGVDAQEFKSAMQSRGLAGFEVWDREWILDRICPDPSLGLIGGTTAPALLEIVSDIQTRRITEPKLERFTRSWIGADDAGARAAIESSLLAHLLRDDERLDLAALTSLHLLRAVRAHPIAANHYASRDALAGAARRLFVSYTAELLPQIEPLLSDRTILATALLDVAWPVTYSASCCRFAELFALLALTADDPALAARAESAVLSLVKDHPGTARPPSDGFTASVVPALVVTWRHDHLAAHDYLRRVCEWILDRYDPDISGLGLASIDESPERVMERLVGGMLESTTLERRPSSYLACLVLDLCLVCGAENVYDAALANMDALRLVPFTTVADESMSGWTRGGDDVRIVARVEYGAWAGERPAHHNAPSVVDAIDRVLLGSVCRSRHDIEALKSLLGTE